MNPIAWALQPLKRYADFKGRSPRAEYWWWFLFQLVLLWVPLMVIFFMAIGSAVLAVQAGSTNPGLPAPGGAFWAGVIFFVLLVLGLIIPNIAVQIRRLHDQDLSGWLILLFFIPYVGGIVAIVFMCIPGTRGPNRFGRDPYEVEDGYLERVFA